MNDLSCADVPLRNVLPSVLFLFYLTFFRVQSAEVDRGRLCVAVQGGRLVGVGVEAAYELAQRRCVASISKNHTQQTLSSSRLSSGLFLRQFRPITPLMS